LVPLQGERTVPRGAPLTVTQVPTLPDSAQAWHCPPHATLQQTPSTQLVLVHSPPLWQAVPLPLSGAQAALGAQYWPLAQGRLALQPPEHLVVSAHWLLAQLMVAAVVQAPALLQTVVTDEPANVQAVPLLPLHIPAQGTVPPQGARPLRGAPETDTHTPTLPDSAQP
jgi:hypothetical protein